MRSSILTTIVLLSISSLAVGQTAPAEPNPWLTDLESATKLAADTNRLVLVHFWAPWCSPCMRLEREVFSHRGLSPALDRQFVRCKLNHDKSQKVAQQFGIESLPADVIITPQGQVLAKMPSPQSASEYVSQMSQVAANYQVANQQAGANQLAAATPGTLHAAGYTQAAPGTSMPNAQQASANGAQQQIAQQPASPYQPNSPYLVQGSAPATPPQPAVTTAAVPAFALDGYCPVQLAEHQRWIPGDKAHGAVYLGHTYLFAGPEEKKRFTLEPDKFSPVAAGCDCILLLERSQQVPGKREHGVFFGGRVYLFSSEETLARFSQDPRRYVAAIAQSQHR
jgi:YHS domain-containing protein/thioredoxin-related protein